MLVLALCALAPVQARADVVTDGTVTAVISDEGTSLCNELVCRTWVGRTPVTASLTGRGVSSQAVTPDFSLTLDGVSIPSSVLPVEDLQAQVLDKGGIRLVWTLGVSPVVTAVRVVEAYSGIAGFRSQTTLTSLVPIPLSGYTLDEVGTGPGDATAHAFRAGADWREPDWAPQLGIGDTHTGDWRLTTTGSTVDAPGEWLSVEPETGGRVGIVAERRDYASSRVAFDGSVARAVVDFSRDVVYTGPFEESIHAENPGPGPARHRVLIPGRALALEPAFTLVAADADEEPWTFYEYLVGRRLEPYRREVTFNTNRVDSNLISTGAKDDVDFDRFVTLAEGAREMGVDTFVLDDGWQAISGDWCPDSPACPEPRYGTSPKFEPRFPDETFAAVREVLAGDPEDPADDMRLGLWMTPMEFHPASEAFQTNPQWACAPVGDGTAALSIVDPDSGSNDAGLGVWNPVALGIHPDTGEVVRLIEYIEDRIERAITVYGATYFKFDFLVWVDCGGAEPVDMYGYHDAFVEMVDRLIAHHPGVTFQIDETNDYRLFPFESIARGPSWFQNGGPASDQLLHNLWNLAPYVPGFSLGQHVLGNGSDIAARGIDMLMAASLGSHVTFWNEPDTELTPVQRAQVKRWTDFYEANPSIAGFTYPLLEDPLAKRWTALQPWDHDVSSGWVIAFRQDDASASTEIPLRGLDGLPADATFQVTQVDPASGLESSAGTLTAEQLRAHGVPLSAGPWGYAIVRIEPAQ